MASTNKTTNYELSQYVGTDKPTYLGDYNSDMSKIDTAMHTNATNVAGVVGDITLLQNNQGVLSTLTTTEKSSLVGAINEVDYNSKSNTTNIGTLSNLTTTNKTTVVNAINEVNGKIPVVYSTNETETNEIWTDGKPIYQKVFSGATVTNNEIDIDVSSLNIDHVISMSGFAKSLYNNNWVIPSGAGTPTNYNNNAWLSGNTLKIAFNSNYNSTGNYHLIVKYTKTSD